MSGLPKSSMSSSLKTRNTSSPDEAGSDAREKLILELLPQVRLIARRIHERLPESVSLDDLVSTGVVGLISAIDHFKPEHNVGLKTYAEYKIRGAIMDSLRGLDWLPRQQRIKRRQIEAAAGTVEQRVRRKPADDEIAHELGLSLEEYQGWIADLSGTKAQTTDSSLKESGGRALLDIVLDLEENLPDALLERAELNQLIAKAIEQDIEQISRELGLTEEQVRQIVLRAKPPVGELPVDVANTSGASLANSPPVDTERVIPVIAHAIAVFGDEHKASHWLKSELPLLEGRTPAQVLTLSGGVEQVERILTRIEHNIPS